MQKNNKKGSILLWAVMLSLIISITFIAISTKINKNIKLSWEINNFIEENNKISLSLKNWINKNISDNKVIIFENNKENVFSLKKWEKKDFSFSWSSDFSIDISIVNWAAVNYNYIFNWNTTSSWVINYSKSFSWNLDNSTKTGSLIIENLWWYTKFLINSENSFETSEKNYKIVTKIWNSFFNETKNAK